jgi:hypothetical protein
MHYLLNLGRFKIYTRIHTNIAPTLGVLCRAQHTECSNITLARLSTSSLMMVEDRNM